MSNINVDFLIKEIVAIKHEEAPEVQSPEFQAFINGWNNALEEVIKYLKQNNGDNN
jgi:hypothetical protein